MQCFPIIAQRALHAGTCLAHASACGTGNWLGEGMVCLGRVHSQVRLQLSHTTSCVLMAVEHLGRPGVTGLMLSAAAPLFMTGTQFLLQNVLARLVLRTGLARRSAAAQVLEWKQYVREGAGSQSSVLLPASLRLHLACSRGLRASHIFACHWACLPTERASLAD